MRELLNCVAYVAIACGLACGNPSGPQSGLNIVSGGNLSDTVGTTLKPPLTVALLDGNLQPMSGQTVYFNTGGPVLVAPINSPGSGINHLPVITDANGQAAVLVQLLFAAGPGKVVVVAPSGQSVEVHYTVLPGAPAYVRADPPDTVLYVGGTETFRPFITDAYGDRRSDMPSYQYASLNSALSLSAPGRATGAVIGRGSVAVTSLGFTDTVWASVVPKGHLAAQGGYIVVMNLDGSAFDTIPGPFHGGRSLDWSTIVGSFVFDVDGPEYLVSLDMTGQAHRVVSDPLMRSEFYPRFALDGSYVYFTGNDSVSTCYGVWRIRKDSTALEHVVADTRDCGVYAYLGGPSPDYASSPSPDGTRLVYVGGTGIPYVGGTLRVRTLATGADTSLGVMGDVPRWSPTGEWIAYDSTGMLMLIRPDGTGRQALLYRGDYLYPAVSWSPDGEWLVFFGFNYYGYADKPTGFTGLKIVQVTTGLRLPLLYARDLTDPTWQP